MISPQAFSLYRSSIMAVLAVFVLIAGTNFQAFAADACRLPASSIFSAPGGSGRAASLFSSLGSGGLTGQFAAGSVQFTEPIYTIRETSVTATILISRTGDLVGPVTVNYSTSNGTATAGQDYGSASGTLFWPDGDGEVKGFVIPITDDLLSEGDETVNITLSNPVGDIVIGSPGQAVLLITDNEQSFELSINDISMPEGNVASPVAFPVTMSGAAALPVTVNYSTADGTATAPSDYSAAVGQITFAPGQTSALVLVNVNGDTIAEPDEYFTVTLNDPVNAMIADGTGTATILNDDAPATPTPTPTPTPGPPASVQFSSTAFSVNESVLGATITVTRIGSGSGAVSVNYASANGSATAGVDYTGVSGTLSWANGDTAPKSFTVQITDDTDLENNETINLTLSGPSGATLGAPASAVLTIIDNDSTPQVSINDVSQAEGNGLNSFAFTVTLSNPSQQPVTLIYSTENGTATAGSDYVGIANSMLLFSPGEVSKQVVINVLGDFVVEPDEDFLLNIISATNAVVLDSQGVGTLVNDDAPGTIQFQSGTYTVNEGAGNAAITITRTGGLSQGVTVRFVTVDGTALSGTDYVTVRTTVVFAPDEATRTILVPILNDSVDELDETVNLALEAPTGGAILGSPINAILTIVDDDAAPVLSVNDVTQNEGNTGSSVFTFTVSLSAASSQQALVFYSTANGTASAPGDYGTIQQGVLTFEPGEISKQVQVSVVGDFINEPNETFRVTLSGPVGATIGDAEGIGTIVNDDVGGAFRFTSAEYLVGENQGAISITVQRTGGLSNGAAVNYSTANGTAFAGSDYTAVSGTLVFEGGQTTRSFVVPIISDGLTELDESFSVILSNASGGGSTLGVPNAAMVFISDSATVPEDSTGFDYDGDGKADIAVHRPSTNFWYLQRSTAGFTGIQWGIPGDKLAPADYDGDGKTDIAVFRPSEGAWYVIMSESQTFQAYSWGAPGDLPVPADHDGDGKSDLVVYRDSDTTFYKTSTTGSFFQGVQFGAAGDKPQIGDFDADGKADVAVFRPSDNNWYVLRSSGGFTAQQFGEAGDIPTPADYDGDGKTDPAVYRPSTGMWYRLRSLGGGYDAVEWGIAGDIPAPADYDGDGKADPAVFRPSEGVWYLHQTTAGLAGVQFGQAGDVPVPTAFRH